MLAQSRQSVRARAPHRACSRGAQALRAGAPQRPPAGGAAGLQPRRVRAEPQHGRGRRAAVRVPRSAPPELPEHCSSRQSSRRAVSARGCGCCLPRAASHARRGTMPTYELAVRGRTVLVEFPHAAYECQARPHPACRAGALALRATLSHRFPARAQLVYMQRVLEALSEVCAGDDGSCATAGGRPARAPLRAHALLPPVVCAASVRLSSLDRTFACW